MIFCNGRNQSNYGLDKIGGIEAPSESHLNNADLDLLARKVKECDNGYELKKSQRNAGVRNALIDLARQPNDFLGRDFLVADADAFGKRHKMRRGVEADSI